MNKYRRALIDYWLEIGKLRREDSDSGHRYFFIRTDGIELEYRGSWKKFFASFNYFNEMLFVNGPLLDSLYNVSYHYFDPWTDPTFILMSFNFNELGERVQKYQGVEQLKKG